MSMIAGDVIVVVVVVVVEFWGARASIIQRGRISESRRHKKERGRHR
jgi:hypothetical protein